MESWASSLFFALPCDVSDPMLALRAVLSSADRMTDRIPACSYLVEFGVCYLVLAERNDSKRLAFEFLAELEKEFRMTHGDSVMTAARPYSFMSFGALWAARERSSF